MRSSLPKTKVILNKETFLHEKKCSWKVISLIANCFWYFIYIFTGIFSKQGIMYSVNIGQEKKDFEFKEVIGILEIKMGSFLD